MDFQRYNRQIILPEIGLAGQQQLNDAKVLVIGAGGLGCPILQYLVAAGVGNIGIVDADVVSISNLQRQILYTTADIDKKKVEVAKERLLAINPNVNIQTFPVNLSADNALALFAKYDIIVDGSDNFATRYLVNDASVILNKPFVSGSIFKFEGQVSVFNFQEGPTYRCLYAEPPTAGSVPNCAEIGVIGTLAGIIGTMQAAEVIKMITGAGEVLSGKLLMFDMLTMRSQIIKFKAIPENKQISKLVDYQILCGDFPVENTHVIDIQTLEQWIEEQRDFQLIDVRNPHEFERDNIGGINIPLDDLLESIDEINLEKTIVFCCQTGLRSAKAIELLKSVSIEGTFLNLGGGI
ncbi:MULTISPECIES: molybdopterin-synthase adenylyltransferase MoeB [unclassified Arcicella]|uniref:molybdopterin-synthase adenylyltransferase MoeB n=1 Tax=unclassified Arcicella TaxID=2644986 RepID=UPI002856CBCB|nr:MULTISPECIES: molybdopterin-synthase adenylyltransferase MoeB [unclassified Arcicella]MDR6562956.1 adenylyltransferase/sulfurtransferase [Arcicella sp. BE51]MDR6813040.1 adenylyltransferase/sulfurtransferase [Arcicella sp. BE140]MDR6824354.1 adenylyltransferase/sulfurtransferase [Arcicella sp. BE139]